MKKRGRPRKRRRRAPGRDLAASADERGIPHAPRGCEASRAIHFRICAKNSPRGGTMRGKRGQGRVYQKKGSRNWWIKFSANGRTIQNSANTESKREAQNVLKTQILRYANGELTADSRNTTAASLAESMISAWRLHGRGPHSIKWAAGCWKQLLGFLWIDESERGIERSNPRLHGISERAGSWQRFD